MAWKATGQPTVRKQRDKWVVRVDGMNTATGKHRPRLLLNRVVDGTSSALLVAGDTRGRRAWCGRLSVG